MMGRALTHCISEIHCDSVEHNGLNKIKFKYMFSKELCLENSGSSSFRNILN